MYTVLNYTKPTSVYFVGIWALVKFNRKTISRKRTLFFLRKIYNSSSRIVGLYIISNKYEKK